MDRSRGPLSLREGNTSSQRSPAARRTLRGAREILPNALPSAVVMLGLIFAQVILVEASLGFLGLGDCDTMSLGSLAHQGQRLLQVAWWLPLFPGLAILVAVLGLNLMSDTINDVLGARR